MERSFARSKRYGYKRARWRRLWRVQIQEYLTTSIQKMMVLIRNVKEQLPTLAMAQAKPGDQGPRLSLEHLYLCFKKAITFNINQFYVTFQ